jgi:hypothetical protein
MVRTALNKGDTAKKYINEMFFGRKGLILKCERFFGFLLLKMDTRNRAILKLPVILNNKNMRKLFAILFATTFIFFGCGQLQTKDLPNDFFNKTVKQISDSLPSGWTVRTDTTNDEIIIHSSVIDLNPDMTSNDSPRLNGQCEIYILMVPRISPDSINIIRKKNKELQNNLPPQSSKDSLKSWYNKNEKTLKILDSEPTNYDNNYSYRIKCRRLPKNETDIIKYNKIIAYLNNIYKKYQD